MKTRILFLVAALLSMAGCAATARLYPVQVALSALAPQPVFPGKISGFVNSGSVSFTLTGGEACKGQWTRVVPMKTPTGATISDAPAANGMPAVWDAVYGPGYYVSHVLGSSLYARAAITGSKGTLLDVEFYKPGTMHLFGVAKDSKGNTYKMVFPYN